MNHELKFKHPTRKDKAYPKNRKDWLAKYRKYNTCFILLYDFHSKPFFGLLYIQRVAQDIRHARCVVRASGSRHFEGTPCLHPQESGHFALRTSGTTHRTSQGRIPEKLNPQQQRCENLKFRTVVLQSCWPTVHLTTLLACWDSGFESRRVPGRLSIVSVMSCQTVSTSGWSLIQRSLTECGGSTVIVKSP